MRDDGSGGNRPRDRTVLQRLRGMVKSLVVSNPTKANYKFVMRDWIRLLDLEFCSQVLETKRFSRNLKPVAMAAPEATAILTVAPHPDDDIIGPGGTLIKAIDRGARAEPIYLTNGVNEPGQAASIKEDATRVCRELGVAAHFLECPAHGIPVGDEAVTRRFASVLSDLSPQVVFVPFLLDDHDDHRRANQVLMEALDASGLACEIWAYQVYSSVIPNVVVDITAQMERKQELMALWRNVQGNRDWAHFMTGVNAANCRYVPRKGPVYAETFFVVPSAEYAALCDTYFSHPPERIFYGAGYR